MIEATKQEILFQEERRRKKLIQGFFLRLPIRINMVDVDLPRMRSNIFKSQRRNESAKKSCLTLTQLQEIFLWYDNGDD